MILQKSQNCKKSPSLVFSARISIWGLAQKHFILIEWITDIWLVRLTVDTLQL